MEELSSYHVTFHQPLTTQQIISLYKLSSKNNFNIYLHQDHLIADAGHLTKLLSFFLFVKIDQPVLLIIDGEDIESAYKQLQSQCGDCIDHITRRTKYTGQIMNTQTSITV
ncbi:hypothetical protein MUN89_15110 [Halobacillus salinarum]|uniref:Condensation domain-containing protein n=1 Tax=Halobacillus salinarum TaxID=2932257 RepID=A0ABY4EFL7_9BACI|nr:hypothetical protein [Halobacillus salinarum]UOQ43252.1 hypothetical protein MUN89_15110 [Halobacillus salinarum]